MAILRNTDGQFYNVPDDQLAAMRVPAGQVKALLTSAAAEGLAMQKGSEAGDVVTPHEHDHGRGRGCWRNCWSRNCWHNCWRNCWH